MANLQVCFITTTMGLAYGDILLWIIPGSSLRTRGYGQAAIGVASGLVAMCISMRSF